MCGLGNWEIQVVSSIGGYEVISRVTHRIGKFRLWCLDKHEQLLIAFFLYFDSLEVELQNLSKVSIFKERKKDN